MLLPLIKLFRVFSWHCLTGLLEPLPIGAGNFRERLDGLLAAMSSDILGRVMGDKLEEDRYCASLVAPHICKLCSLRGGGLPPQYPSWLPHDMALSCLYLVLLCIYPVGWPSTWCT